MKPIVNRGHNGKAELNLTELELGSETEWNMDIVSATSPVCIWCNEMKPIDDRGLDDTGFELAVSQLSPVGQDFLLAWCVCGFQSLLPMNSNFNNFSLRCHFSNLDVTP